ncbi:MAG TPA: hypothetical protein VMU89_01965 [Thermomicrobiaceae bacterium]|nr:hypothetical protein [Thermomicrobiaceae bacterium]
MSTRHTEDHPAEGLGVDVDAPRNVAQSSATVASGTSFGRMKCYNRSTGAFVGWLGTYNYSVDLVHDADSGAGVAWTPWGSDMYLTMDWSPGYRYLGLGANSYACWGIAGGWTDAIVYNPDHTLSLKSDPKRKLYGPYGNDWVCWSNGEDNQNILRCELES